MNVREKLIGLIAKAKYICANDYSDHTEDEYIADTLLDNGVTVHGWIPVTERLPGDGQSVLTYKNGIYDIQTYEERRNGWVSGNWFWLMATVTHWMPLPGPPKGE